MTATPAQVVQYYLIAQGLGVQPSLGTANNWPITRNSMPDSETIDNRIAVLNSGSFQEGRQQRTGERTVHPTVQILLRCSGTDADVGLAKGRAIETALDAIRHTMVTVLLESIVVKGAHITTVTTPVGVEEKNRRFLFSINLMLTF